MTALARPPASTAPDDSADLKSFGYGQQLHRSVAYLARG
jgi:hypothetical protein